jgi:rhamnose transport system substrate-binding protein
MLRPRLLLAVAALALIAIGCGDSSKTEGGTTGTASGTSGKKLKLVYIPKNTGNPYFDTEIEGFREACLAAGVEFTTTGPAKAEPASQIPILQEQIQRGVDIIAVTPNAPDTLNPVLDEAKAQGITVVCVDSDLTGNESHRDAAVLPTDFSKIGPEQVELLGSMINYEGSIAILSATKEAPNQSVWVAAMQEALKDPKYSKMVLKEIAYGNDEPQKSTTEFEALLAKYPDLKGVISPTSVGLAAAAQSLSVSGNYPGGPKAKNGGIVLTGLSTPNQMKTYVEQGVCQKFQLWNPKDMGIIATHLALGIKKGTLKPGDGVSFDVPGFGSRAFGKNNVVLAGPLTTFDKTNVGKFNF